MYYTKFCSTDKLWSPIFFGWPQCVRVVKNRGDVFLFARDFAVFVFCI